MNQLLVKSILCVQCANHFAVEPELVEKLTHCPYCRVPTGSKFYRDSPQEPLVHTTASGETVTRSMEELAAPGMVDELEATAAIRKFKTDVTHHGCPTFWIISNHRDFWPSWCPFCGDALRY